MSLTQRCAGSVAMLVAGATLAACGPQLTLHVVENRPYEKPRVTDGDYTASGAFHGRILDQAGACLSYDPSKNGRQVTTIGAPPAAPGAPPQFYAELDTQVRDQDVQVAVLINDFRGAGTYRYAGPMTTMKSPFAFVILHLGSADLLTRGAAAANASQHLYRPTSATVTIAGDGAGRVSATLVEVAINGSSALPLPGAQPMQLNGIFRCVEPDV